MGIQFRLWDLMFSITCFATWAGILAYGRPRHMVLLIVAPIAALTAGAIIGSVPSLTGSRLKWLVPLSVAVACLTAFAVGKWVQVHFYP